MLKAIGEFLAVFILVVIVRLFSLERKPGNVFLLFSYLHGFSRELSIEWESRRPGR